MAVSARRRRSGSRPRPRTIGIFGGTFDPPHLGHLAAADEAAFVLDLHRVLFVPNSHPPHKSNEPVSDIADRLAMLWLAIGDNSRFGVSLIELEREGPSYSLDTLRAIKTRLGEHTRLIFLLGTDVLTTLHTWHEPAALLDEFEVVLMARADRIEPDWATADTHFPGIRNRLKVITVNSLQISSHDIRARARARLPFRYLVTDLVYIYIERHGLYRRH